MDKLIDLNFSEFANPSAHLANFAGLGQSLIESDSSENRFGDKGTMKCLCGESNPTNADYCKNCGRKLESSQENGDEKASIVIDLIRARKLDDYAYRHS